MAGRPRSKKPKAPSLPEAQATLAVVEEASDSSPFYKIGKRRPSRLETEPSLSRDIFNLVCSGVSITAASQACGVHHSSEGEWAAKGRQGIEPYATHYADLQAAKAIFESRLVTGIFRIGLGLIPKGNAMALCWLLERRCRDEYWLSKKIELTGEGGRELGLLTLEQLQNLVPKADWEPGRKPKQ